MATAVLCLQQQQPAVSRALLEFLEELAKLETNPISCDHRIAGLLQVLRAERLLAVQTSAGCARCLQRGAEGDDVAVRDLAFELERRLHAAQHAQTELRGQCEAGKEQTLQLQEKHSEVVQEREHLHKRLVESEEKHIGASEALVEQQLQNAQMQERFSELQCADGMLLALLQEEVAELCSAAQKGDVLEGKLASKASECADTEARFETCVAEAEAASAASAASRAAVSEELQQATESEALVSAEVQAERQRSEGLWAEVAAAEAEVQAERHRSEGLWAEVAATEARAPLAAEVRQPAAEAIATLAAEVEADMQPSEGRPEAAAEAALVPGSADGTDRFEGEAELVAQLRAELQAQGLRAEHCEEELEREAGRLGVEQKRLEAAVLELELRSMVRPRSAGPTEQGAPLRLADVQSQLRSDMAALHPTVGQTGVPEQPRAIGAQVEQLERRAPAEQRLESHRIALMEKSMQALEAERSELIVRATVAEEQLKHLQRHLKEMTEAHQRQLLHLRLQLPTR